MVKPSSRRVFLRGLAGLGVTATGVAGEHWRRAASRSSADTQAQSAPTTAARSATPVIDTTASATTSELPVAKVATPATADQSVPDLHWQSLPRWRGFNLLERFRIGNPETNRDFDERDLDAIAEWGFDFVRVPADYRTWTGDDGTIDDTALGSIERLVDLASARGIHVNLSLHRVPGYVVGRDPEGEYDLWGTGPMAERAAADFTAQWALLSDRFNGIPARHLSFGLVNEPPNIDGGQYAAVVRPAVEAIRSRQSGRLIVADGVRFGREPTAEMVPLQVAQATRGYDPMRVTHYKADWISGSDAWPAPTWPLQVGPAATLFGEIKSLLQRPLVLHGRSEERRVGKECA